MAGLSVSFLLIFYLRSSGIWGRALCNALRRPFPSTHLVPWGARQAGNVVSTHRKQGGQRIPSPPPPGHTMLPRALCFGGLSRPPPLRAPSGRCDKAETKGTSPASNTAHTHQRKLPPPRRRSRRSKPDMSPTTIPKGQEGKGCPLPFFWIDNLWPSPSPSCS